MVKIRFGSFIRRSVMAVALISNLGTLPIVSNVALAAAPVPPAPPLASVICANTTSAVGTTSGSTAYALPSASHSCDVVTFINDGTAEIFVNIGSSGVTASTTSLPMPPGSSLSQWTTGSFYAAITSSSTSTIRVIQSNGALAINGGGGGGSVAGTVIATQSTGTNLHMVCDSGCSSSTAPADESAFTAGSTSQTPTGGLYQTSATSNPLTSGQMGVIQLTANRAVFSNLRNSSGTEIATAGAPLQVSIANTAANATSINATITGTLPAFAATPSVNAIQSGSWTIPLPSGAATATNQTAVIGTAGSPSTSVLTVQGVPGATAQAISGTVTVTQGTGTNLHTVCDSGCVSISLPSDEASFAAGSTTQQPAGAFYQTSPSSSPLTNGQMGMLQATAQRALFTNVRNSSGTEVGTSSNPFQVTLANTGTNSNALLVSGSGGSFPVNGTVTVTQGTGTNLHTVCDSGCSGSAPADESSFTAGSTTQTPVGGFFQTVPTANALSNGQQGTVQLTANRAVFSNLRNAAGTEIATASNPVQVSIANTAANGTAMLVTGTGGTFPIQGPADESSFTPGTTGLVTTGGFFQTSPTANALLTGQSGAFQLTANRAIFTNLRSSTGTELGLAAAPLQVSIANTAANATAMLVTGSGGTFPITGTITANAGTNLNTSALALESGNISVVAGAVTAAVMQENVKQVNGVATLAGAGATGTGSQRVTIATDTSTIAGSAVGTAGTASTNVVTVQGIASGVAQAVSGSLTVTQGTGSNLHVQCDSGCSTSTNPADEATFTAGTTPQSPIGGFYQTSPTGSALTTGQMGMVQLTANRAIFSNLRNASGTEIGTSSTPVQVSIANTGVNSTAIATTVGGTLPAFAATPTVLATQPTGSSLHVQCDSGCSSSTAPSDEATFTAGSTPQTPIGGFYQTVVTTAPLTNNQMGAVQLTQYRAQMVNLRTAAGAEIGTAASPVQVSLANSATNSTPVVVTASAGTNLNTSLLALEGGGNLAIIAGSVSGAVQQHNLKQVNGVTTLAGAGATGTGSQRETIAQDISTIGGSAPGTAGAPSTNVVSIQGVTSGTVVPVSLAANTTVNLSQVAGNTTATGGTGLQKVALVGNAGAVLDFVTGATAPPNSLLTGAQVNTSTPTWANGTAWPLQMDAGGNLKVNVTVGGGTGGTSSNFSSAFPSVGTAMGANNGASTMVGILADTAGRLQVDTLGHTGATLDAAVSTTTGNIAPTNALMIGGQYNTAAPTPTTGYMLPLQLDSSGNLKVNVTAGGVIAQNASALNAQGSMIMGLGSSFMNAIVQAEHSVPINISTGTTTQLIALVTSAKIYISSWDVIANGTGNIELEYGTGSNCGTGTTALTGNYNLTAQAGISKGGGLGSILVVPAGNALCALTSAAVGMAGSVSYTQSLYGP